MKQDSQEERWAAFGWNVLSVPGNDMDALVHAFELAKHCKGKTDGYYCKYNEGLWVLP